MLEALGKDESKFGRIYRDSMNREQDEYLLPRREVENLLTGYSIPLRAKVIDRLHEFEEKVKAATVPSLPNFSNPADAARAWAEQWEQRQVLALENQQLSAANQEMAPKTVVFDNCMALRQETLAASSVPMGHG